ncbi:CLAVATA3/ESR (CLE)-related protein [Trema orientale]|uniref:CLAVATA3/ESR (CLE)-related protein n=1 Tax=Trema orientale TaxID=63057 RepID=A0A2P5FMU9_TREOI|nr:CLAVATA3/ESR (CLE)-related protein [Trema orientale]
MAKLGRVAYSVMILFLILILFARSTESRSLKAPMLIEKRNLRQLVDAFKQLAANAGDATDQDKQPSRVSPGGPDPHHHVLNN